MDKVDKQNKEKRQVRYDTIDKIDPWDYHIVQVTSSFQCFIYSCFILQLWVFGISRFLEGEKKMLIRWDDIIMRGSETISPSILPVSRLLSLARVYSIQHISHQMTRYPAYSTT